MRTPVIAGNWKLYKKTAEARDMVTKLGALVRDMRDREVIVSPSFTLIGAVRAALEGSGIQIAGQDCFWEEEGAFTGEVSPGMLVDAGCSHVIIGHSERRRYFGESDETVNRKVAAALGAGLTAIVCIGETLEERESDRTFEVLETQLTQGLRNLSPHDLERTILAYEPVWAIGTGRTARDEQAQEAHAFIRGVLEKFFGAAAAEATRILYGGSVKPDNISGLMSMPDIDGALVGGASLTAESFAAIVAYEK